MHNVPIYPGHKQPLGQHECPWLSNAVREKLLETDAGNWPTTTLLYSSRRYASLADPCGIVDDAVSLCTLTSPTWLCFSFVNGRSGCPCLPLCSVHNQPSGKVTPILLDHSRQSEIDAGNPTTAEASGLFSASASNSLMGVSLLAMLYPPVKHCCGPCSLPLTAGK